jgi:hypothetical protein
MYLYEMVCPAASFTVPLQRGFPAVYPVADSAMAEAGAQLPNAAMLPTTFTVSPKFVVFRTLKVTEIVVAVAQAVDVTVVDVAVVWVVVVVGFTVVLPDPPLGV